MNTVIVGGGFAGVRAALELSKKTLGKVTLVSDEPYFLHHATLYSTATGHSRAESVIALSDIFANHPNVTVVIDKMKSVDQHRKLVVGKADSYKYDKLIIAIGSVTTFFGIGGMVKHAYGIKSLKEIDQFSTHIQQEVIANQHLDKNYYIIGAGPTGVELAAALKEYLQYLVKTHKNTKGRIRITLVEAADRILPSMSITASRLISERLKKLGVKIITGHKVDSLGESNITIEGKKVPTETAVWTCGVANNPFFSKHEHMFHIADNKRVNVDRYLEASEDIYVLGDNNDIKYSGVAWSALREAEFIANHLERLANKKPVRRYHPQKPPSGLPVGSNWGYVEWHGVYLSGRAGHWARRLLELRSYLKILPRALAIPAWRAHYLRDVREIEDTHG